MIRKFFKNSRDQANQKQKERKKNYIPKSFNIEKSQKVVIFITSIIISLGFKGIKIWLIRILASLYRKP